MNDQIDELWEQCKTPLWSKEIPIYDHRLLAELIIRECLVQIGNAIPDTDCSASGAYKTAKIAATSRVKEHFGVEE